MPTVQLLAVLNRGQWALRGKGHQQLSRGGVPQQPFIVPLAYSSHSCVLQWYTYVAELCLYITTVYYTSSTGARSSIPSANYHHANDQFFELPSYLHWPLGGASAFFSAAVLFAYTVLFVRTVLLANFHGTSILRNAGPGHSHVNTYVPVPNTSLARYSMHWQRA